MKEELYKINFERFSSTSHKNTSPINLTSLTSEDDFAMINYSIPTKKHPLFLSDKNFTDEKTYLENYGNPLYSVLKEYVMIVVEKTEDKILKKEEKTDKKT